MACCMRGIHDGHDDASARYDRAARQRYLCYAAYILGLYSRFDAFCDDALGASF